MEYRVRNLKDLTEIIIPFFKQNKLLTNKQFDFNDFSIILYLINKKEHLTISGMLKIKEIKLKMNRNRIKILDKDIVRS